MKIKTRVLILITVLTLNFNKASASLHKFMVTSDGKDILLGSYKDFLWGYGNPQQNQWWIAPSTGQKIFVRTNPEVYRTYFTPDEIRNLVVLPSSKVKGNYQNTGWSDQGQVIAVNAMGPIIPGFDYFCVGTEAKGKANCANLQLKELIIPETKICEPVICPPPCPKPEPKIEPEPLKMDMCLGTMTMGAERIEGDVTKGRYSKNGNYYYHYEDESWWQKKSDGKFKQICLPDEPEEEVKEKVKEKVIVRRIVEPRARREYSNTVSRSDRRFNLGLWFEPQVYSYNRPQQPRYVPQPRYQPQPRRYYPQPRAYDWTGSPSMGGSQQGWYSSGGSPSMGGSNGYNNSNHNEPSMGGGGHEQPQYYTPSISGGGRQPGVGELIDR